MTHELPKLIFAERLSKAAAACERLQRVALSDAAARAMASIRELIVENPADASLEQLVDSFRRALQAYDSGVDTSPAGRARRFADEIDGIIRGRQFGRAIETSLQKGFTPYDFLNNRR